MFERIPKILRRSLAAFAVFYFFSAGLIVIDGMTDSVEKANLIVVLGNEVLADGRPSDRLAARLDRAVELYNQDTAPTILVSGGVGKSGWDEAEVMASYVEEKGVPSESVLIDSDGITTSATAKNAAQVMEENGWNNAVVVTQFFHISRSRLALKKAGVPSVTTARAFYFEPRDVYATLREVPAYIKYAAA